MTLPEAGPRERALLALDGLSVGDALGERFFMPEIQAIKHIRARTIPPPLWFWTDDTQMAISVTETLLELGEIDGDVLAGHFAERYEPHRGYGGGAHRLMRSLRRGLEWRDLAPAMFGGSGSFGNGAAMRIAPLGGYFADDLDAAVDNAARSAEVTHAHPEGISGGVAVAVAAAMAWRLGRAGDLAADTLFEAVLERTPPGLTRDGLKEASEIGPDEPAGRVAERLGSGYDVSAQDTVPFALWCAAHHLDSFEETFWTTVSGLGDRDTTCAIACGVVALSAGEVPAEWLAAREPLDLDFRG